jgi:hypothetical protein
MEQFDPEKTNPRIDIREETISDLGHIIEQANRQSQKEAEILAHALVGKTIRYGGMECDFIKVAPREVAVIIRDRQTNIDLTITPEQMKEFEVTE